MNVAVFSCTSYEAVQRVFGEAKSHLGEILSAFEFFDKQGVSCSSPITLISGLTVKFALSSKHIEEIHGSERKIFETEGDFYCLIETGGSNAEHDEAVSCHISLKTSRLINRNSLAC